ncbi:discoidin domain-containing protein [Rheinheimera marina]|uniref:Discoidin domain-containing protein n=1 Tax=Rheinheimera marina TaxID=1774958 RepID=A0ABV9JGN7_9GAMM
MKTFKTTQSALALAVAFGVLTGCGGGKEVDPNDVPVQLDTTSADLAGSVVKGTLSNAAIQVTQLNGSALTLSSTPRTDATGEAGFSVSGQPGYGINSMLKIAVTADAQSQMVCDAINCAGTAMGGSLSGDTLATLKLNTMTYLQVAYASQADNQVDAQFYANALTTIATALVEKDVAGGRNVAVRALYELALADNARRALRALGLDSKTNVFNTALVSAEAYENFVTDTQCEDVEVTDGDGNTTVQEQCTDVLVAPDVIKLSLLNAAFANLQSSEQFDQLFASALDAIYLAQDGDETALEPLRQRLLDSIAAVPYLDQLNLTAEDVVDLKLKFAEEQADTGPIHRITTAANLATAVITGRNRISDAEAEAKAFDGDTSTKWLDHNDWKGAPTEENPSWIQIQFATPQAVNTLSITSANDSPSRDPENFTVLGSNDGETWVTLGSFIGESFDERFESKDFKFDNGLAYSYYKLNITKNKGDDGLMQLAEIELFGPIYPDLKHPTANANITARGQISDAEAPTKAFDGDTETKWLDNKGVPSEAEPSWVQLDYPAPVAISSLALTSANDSPGRDPENFNLQGSNDGVTWVTLGSWLGESFDERFERQSFRVDNSLAFSSYRLNITKNKGDDVLMQVAEIELIGPEVPGLNHGRSSGVQITGRAAISDGEAVTKAFDGDSSTKWLDNEAVPTAAAPAWAEISLPTAQAVTQLALTSANDAPDRDPENFTLQASKDGETWIDLASWLGVSFDARFQRQIFSVGNQLGFPYYRLNITKNKGDANLMQVAEIELIGPQHQAVVHSHQAGVAITGRAAISDNEAASKAFDGDSSTKWLDNEAVPTAEAPSWVELDMGAEVIVNALALTSANDAPDRDPENFSLLGSNDGESWFTVGSWIGEAFDQRFERKLFNTGSGRAFRFYRVEISKNKGDSNLMQVAEIELIGPDI